MSTTDHGAGEREGFTVERYAEVLAHRRHFHASHRTEVLLRLGVRPSRWAAVTKAWSAAFAEALAADEPEIIVRFVQTLGRTTRRLSEYPPRLEQLGEPIDPHTPEPAGRADVVEVPFYLREPLAAAPPPPAPVATPIVSRRPPFDGTADISAFVPRGPLPFPAHPVAAPPPPAGGPAPAPGPPPPAPAPAAPGAAPTGSPPHPGALLRRFDPATGQPLPVPVWQEPPPGWVPPRKT